MLGGEEYQYTTYFICPPNIGGVIFVLKIVAVALADTKYIILNTPTTYIRPIIHAL